MAINARVVGTLSKDLNLEQVELLLRSIYKGINKLIDSEYANFGELFKSREYPSDWRKFSDNFYTLTFAIPPGLDEFERGMLSLCLNCHCDHKDLAEKSISVSLGYWGESTQIIRVVGEEIKSLKFIDKVFVLENDSIEPEMWEEVL